MRCPRLVDLPAPPPGKTGWPWTVESDPLPERTPGGAAWPALSIVTPSYNQADYLEAAIRSVLLQGYGDLEYVVVDGGSTDGSVEILHKYAPWLTRWSSGPDGGQYDAVNKGFAATGGAVMAWLNSDDMYVRNAFWALGGAFGDLAGSVHWLTGMQAWWDDAGRLCAIEGARRYERPLIRLGCYEGRRLGWIQQESTAWSRDLWRRAGGALDAGLRYAADYFLWMRFSEHEDLYTLALPVAGFRAHGAQKTASLQPYYDELSRHLRLTGRQRRHRWLARRRLGRR